MQLNIRKIDERIQKLQEIKRIAADPEMVAMLLEFIAGDEAKEEPLLTPRAVTAVAATAQPTAQPTSQTTAQTTSQATSQPTDIDLVNQVVKGLDAQANGFWPRKR
jgi:hypothetical protein